MVRRVTKVLLMLCSSRAVGLRLLETLWSSWVELLRGKHGWVQPVVSLVKLRSVGGVLVTKLLIGRILILRHEHVAHTMLRSDVVVKLLVEHD